MVVAIIPLNYQNRAISLSLYMFEDSTSIIYGFNFYDYYKFRVPCLTQ